MLGRSSRLWREGLRVNLLPMKPRAKLTAYTMPHRSIDLRAAPHERDWMDETDQRYAYRCLPLAIANAHGWEILCPSGFTASWHGSVKTDAITIAPDGDSIAPAISHFGYGILTFHIPAVFRTEPGYDLMAQGPINRPKDGIGPLSGVVETDWAPFTFTMNWMFTRPGEIRFEEGEPICHIFPIQRGELECFDPVVRPLTDNPALHAEFNAWSESRAKFNTGLRERDPDVQAEKWQKHYYRGRSLDGTGLAGDDHRTRIRLAPFRPPDRDG